MISEISRECFLDNLSKKRGNIPEKIKALSALAAYSDGPRFFKTGLSLLFTFGKEALIFGNGYSPLELKAFLSFLGITSIGGSCEKLSGEKKELIVMLAKGADTDNFIKSDILSSARLFSSVFGGNADDIYPDLCIRINKSAGRLFSTENGACFLHTSSIGNLLTAVAVKEDFRGKGEGSRLVKSAVNAASGKVFIVCEESKRGFYEKCGFSIYGKSAEVSISGGDI